MFKSNITKISNFSTLTLDCAIESVEQSYNQAMQNFAHSLPSYINRVYEMRTLDNQSLIIKFYRPQRWNYDAIADEHEFVFDCAENEIPVITPLLFPNGDSIAENKDGIFFAVYPKKQGRELELNNCEDWQRLGQIIGRLHIVGDGYNAEHRLQLHPQAMTVKFVDELLSSNLLDKTNYSKFAEISRKIITYISDRFDDVEYLRTHGDCHRANVLNRLDEGLMIIDFDDMLMAPAVQDLWLLLPDHIHKCRNYFYDLLDGYWQFRDFNEQELFLIEPLRAMRMIYFLHWCAFQSNDARFQANFPDWGTEQYWRQEVNDLEHQFHVIKEADKALSKLGNIIL